MKEHSIEAFLDKFGCQWTYAAEVPLETIIRTEAARQNIRPIGLDDDTVMKYALAMEDGAEFPAVVLYARRDGSRSVLTGLHRIAASELAKRASIDAYLVVLDEDKDVRTIEVLQRALNMLNGLGYGREERLQHALRIVGLGYSATDAARLMGLKAPLLLNRMSAISARERAISMNVAVNDEFMKDGSLTELNRLKHPEFFKLAFELSQAARLTAQQVKDLSLEIREATTDTAARAVIEAWQVKMAPVIKETLGGRFQGPTSPARRSLTYLSRLDRAMRVESFAALTPLERKAAIREIKAAIQRLQKVVVQLESNGPLIAAGAQRKGGRRAAQVRRTH